MNVVELIEKVADELSAEEQAAILRLVADAMRRRSVDIAVEPEPTGDGGPWLSPKQAAALVSRDKTTVIRWARAHGIGRRNGGRYEISKPLLEKLASCR